MVWAAVGLAGALALGLVLRPRSLAIETAPVDRGTVRVTLEEDGETRVRDRYVVSTPVTGLLRRADIEVGDTVIPGAIVARIYPLPLDPRGQEEAMARVAGAEAAAAAAQARLRQAEEVARDAARRLARVEPIAGQIMSRDELDRLTTTAGSAELDVEAARRAAEQAAQGVRAERAALMARVGGGTGEPALLRAPAAGRILRLYEDDERPVLAGAPLLEIGDVSRLQVVVDVLSSDALRITPGAAVRVVAGPESDTLVGRVRRIEPSAFTRVSPLGVEEQRVNVIADFEPSPPPLGDGFRVDVSIVVGEATGVTRVPLSAVFRSGTGWAVWVVDGGRARLRGIEIARRGQGMGEVVRGLTPGERVIPYPSDAVREGVRVRDRRPTESPPPA